MTSRFAVVSLLLLAGCNAKAAPAESGVVDSPLSAEALPMPIRDTSGMLVHEFAATVLQQVPRFAINADPVTEVRGRDFGGDLARASEPLVLRDGRLVLFHEGSVLILGQNGSVEEKIGRSGAGPGEFRDGVIVRGLADTLLIYDRTNGRIAFVVPGTGVIRLRPLSPSVLRHFTGVIGQYADDALLVGTQGFALAATPGAPTRAPWYAARIPRGSGSIQLVDSVPGPTIVSRADGPAGVRYTNFPVTVAWGSDFLVSEGSTWRLERLAATGEVLARYSIPLSRRPVTPDKRDEDTKVRLQRLRLRNDGSVGRRDTTVLYRTIRESPTATHLPLIAKAIVGPDEIAWVKDGGYWFADKKWGWTAFHRDGLILGRLEGVGEDPVVTFGTNSVVVRAEDEDGFVTFRVHRLSIR